MSGAAGVAPGGPRPTTLTGRGGLSFRLFVLTVVGLGSVGLMLAVSSLDLRWVLQLEPAFWAACALLLAAEVRPLFTAGARDANGHALSTAFVFALMLRYGLPVALVVQALAVALSDPSRGWGRWRTAFNVGQFTLSWTVAAVAMQAVGWPGWALEPTPLEGGVLLAAAVGGLTYFAVNQSLVTGAMALQSGFDWWRLLRKDFSYEAVTNGAMLALAPLIVLAIEAGPAFLPLLLPPLFAVYKVGSIALDRERQALTDTLTGLPNRKQLAERSVQAFEQSDVVALLLFDLDRFKEVNDTLGHHAGDQLLEIVAARLSAASRPGDTVARLGGDEFAVLLPGADRAVADHIARRLLTDVSAPFLIQGVQVDIGASVGVAVAPEDGSTLAVLLQHADVAMYLAKGAGGGVEQYDPGRDRNSTGRLVMLGELRRAIRERELEVHYQPTARLGSGAVDGVEALVRWRHPERGWIPPGDFIPLAEGSGLMDSLTAFVLDAAVEQLASWHRLGLDLRMAVNVSIRDLAGGQLGRLVAEVLARHQVAASALQLEVTEGHLVADSRHMTSTLDQLEALGVALSLDDFGTGYSSLGHLRRLPVRELKIDRSFVSRMSGDPRDRAIVRSVVDLAAGLHMRVVAEGVEDQQTWDALREMGCDSAQGWHLSAAEPADVLTPWMLSRQRRELRAVH